MLESLKTGEVIEPPKLDPALVTLTPKKAKAPRKKKGGAVQEDEDAGIQASGDEDITQDVNMEPASSKRIGHKKRTAEEVDESNDSESPAPKKQRTRPSKKTPPIEEEAAKDIKTSAIDVPVSREEFDTSIAKIQALVDESCAKIDRS